MLDKMISTHSIPFVIVPSLSMIKTRFGFVPLLGIKMSHRLKFRIGTRTVRSTS